MATSAIAVASWLEAGACRVSSATASFVGAPTAALLARTPRQNSDPLLSPCSRVCLRFALPASDELTIMSSVFCGSSHRWAFGGGVRRRTSRLAGRRKGHEFSLEDEKEHGRRGTGEEEFYWRWISASERRSTEADDDVWSKHSVFEFRRSVLYRTCWYFIRGLTPAVHGRITRVWSWFLRNESVSLHVGRLVFTRSLP